jgi:hypothetical protein
VEITGIFEQLSIEEVVELASKIEVMWNAKLRLEFGETLCQAKMLHDTELGEIFVTICREQIEKPA